LGQSHGRRRTFTHAYKSAGDTHASENQSRLTVGSVELCEDEVCASATGRGSFLAKWLRNLRSLRRKQVGSKIIRDVPFPSERAFLVIKRRFFYTSSINTNVSTSRSSGSGDAIYDHVVERAYVFQRCVYNDDDSRRNVSRDFIHFYASRTYHMTRLASVFVRCCIRVYHNLRR